MQYITNLFLSLAFSLATQSTKVASQLSFCVLYVKVLFVTLGTKQCLSSQMTEEL